ncbi:MAG: hypothetical protein OIF40_13000 [Mangrovicoccus sp.]|nr:hypothetical protein [Mangrovicoccus sp.]
MGILKSLGRILAGGLLLGLVALGMWNLFSPGPPVAPISTAPEGFDLSQLLVLTDADMAATGYADGQLYPIEGARDHLIVLENPGSPNPERKIIQASNTVMGWPGPMTADPSTGIAYVIEGRGPAPKGATRMGDVFAEMPAGGRLTSIDLHSGAILDQRFVCAQPNNIDIAPDRRWLLVACGDPEAEITVLPLQNGLPAAPRRIDLDLDEISKRGPIDAGLSYAMIHPSGQAAGYIQSNLAVGLLRFRFDAQGLPVGAQAEPPVQQGHWLSTGRWSNRGKHFLVADVKWGPTALGALFVPKGEIHAFALSPTDQRRGILSSATVSRSPEGFEINRAGDRLAVVNMERTYLPGGMFTLVPGRRGASLSLLAFDDATGQLQTLSPPIGFAGVLPEDVVFDRDGDHLAVAVFQDHNAPRSPGWIAFFAITDDQIHPTGRRIPMPRGAHDLFAID